MSTDGPLVSAKLFNFQSSDFYSLHSVQNNDMIIPKHNIESFKRSSQYSGAIIWNHLPTALQTACSLPAFKHH